jgi:MazG family protein
MPARKPKQKPKRKSNKRGASQNRKFTPPRVGPAFQKLVAVMSRLRSPNGCPWDREQTHSTLRTYLIEEAYEVLEALDSTDDTKFAEELGDLLLQVLFHAQIAHEEGRFDISAVIREIHDKMIRRHPHVFGTTRANTAAEVLHNWEQIKQQERQSKRPELQGLPLAQGESASPAAIPSSTQPSILDGIPRSIPALLEALQLTRKAARIGFDWPNPDGIFSKLTEETNELKSALIERRSVVAGLATRTFSQGESASPAAGSFSSIEGELGDILFVAVNLARHLNIDPEIALKRSSAKFSNRFRTMERLAQEQNTTLAKIPRSQMESLWEQAKQLEPK